MTYMEQVNSSYMYMLASSVVIFVFIQACFFLIRAYKEGRRIGMDKQIMKKVIVSSAIFTIVPSMAILIGVVVMSGTLGVPLPWMRLSVIGALHYELMAADVAAKGLGLPGLVLEYMNMEVFVSIILVMSIGIIWGGIFCIFGLKKYQSKIQGISKGDSRWGNIIFQAMFVGMVSAYIATSIGVLTIGNIIPIVVMIGAALSMWILEKIMTRYQVRWMDNFSLAISMVIGMGLAIIVS